ncbi:MAG: acyl-CoA dehydrogenase family protein [Fuerstiella sp.]
MDDVLQSTHFQGLIQQLIADPCLDQNLGWPNAQLRMMADAGVMQWDIPIEFGGTDLPSTTLIEALRQMASACLTSTFVWTQRSAAVRRIATSSNAEVKDRLLPALRSGDLFATVGISHLTTSGQHLKKPLVEIREHGADYIVSGLVPWSTGATMADVLVTGGALQDGRQMLVSIPTNSEGVQAKTPVELMALNASQTGAVELSEVRVSASNVLHGPIENVMSQGTGGGAGSLGTSALAIGAACGSIRQFAEEATKRPDLNDYVVPLQSECDQLTEELHQAASGSHPLGSAAGEQLRRRANSLAMRAAQSWLAATKGAGFVAGHPAERAVRESMFFLVWSCPQPVLHGNLSELTCTLG